MHFDYIFLVFFFPSSSFNRIRLLVISRKAKHFFVLRNEVKSKKANRKFHASLASRTSHILTAQVFGFIKLSSEPSDISIICPGTTNFRFAYCNIWKKLFTSSHEYKQMKWNLCILFLLNLVLNQRKFGSYFTR